MGQTGRQNWERKNRKPAVPYKYQGEGALHLSLLKIDCLAVHSGREKVKMLGKKGRNAELIDDLKEIIRELAKKKGHCRRGKTGLKKGKKSAEGKVQRTLISGGESTTLSGRCFP